ncbi:hypothetical protein NPIL_543991 [Nephila pilipes]|uniref:Reverse transcriptase domain-containing protein n=1 Tax=Nephila pilipes TaxID=299642 RepID=A0A8X6TS70_NEPPI|nr:hypothetical protein NPIL_545001 [Nephila pilipes]GFU35476.1 hypothetical protein NPIL_543991 [Nephila pilipes]
MELICTTLDPRVLNTKLLSLVKNISRDQPQVKKYNVIQDCGGAITKNDRKAANLIGDWALPWIYNFLRDMITRVKLSNFMPRSFKLNQGFHQGSVLSPTLLTVALCGIEEIISRRCVVDLIWVSIPYSLYM